MSVEQTAAAMVVGLVGARAGSTAVCWVVWREKRTAEPTAAC